MKNCFYLLIFSILLFACSSQKSLLKGSSSVAVIAPYLGQKPPGILPIRFAPDVVCTENYEYGGVFTPDMKEFYCIKQGGRYKESSFVVFQNNSGKWEESIVSEWVGQPTFSQDGKTMYLGSRYMERTDSGWSEIKDLNAPFKDLLIMRLSASNNGTLYFDTYEKDKPNFPIRYSRLIDGKYEEPKVLSVEINTGIKNINHPFIAPDESYLIWDAVREEGFGKSDIYISFKQNDGSWGPAINFGDSINTEAWEAAASITPDGKYLFFNRNMGSDSYEDVDIFWVDAKIIEKLKVQ